MKAPVIAIAILAVLAVSVRAAAKSGADEGGWSAEEKQRIGRMLGELTFRPVSVDFDELPAREAINDLNKQVRVPIIARYADDAFGYGIDPNTPITIELKDAPALDVLTEILAQCSRHDPCTWQIRKSYVEVGTKERLSVPAARVKRLHYVADLLIDIPDRGEKRLPPQLVALDLVEDIVKTVEPGSWDYGQIDYDRWEESDGLIDHPLGGPTSTDRFIEMDPEARRYIRPRTIAIIRYWRDWMIIDAPDYIHRQIAGYPKPIRPNDLSPGSEEISDTRVPE